jgi:hypothetical protein
MYLILLPFYNTSTLNLQLFTLLVDTHCSQGIPLHLAPQHYCSTERGDFNGCYTIELCYTVLTVWITISARNISTFCSGIPLAASHFIY